MSSNPVSGIVSNGTIPLRQQTTMPAHQHRRGGRAGPSGGTSGLHKATLSGISKLATGMASTTATGLATATTSTTGTQQAAIGALLNTQA